MATVRKSKVNYRKLDLVANLRRENDELAKVNQALQGTSDQRGVELREAEEELVRVQGKLRTCMLALSAALAHAGNDGRMAAIRWLLSAQ